MPEVCSKCGKEFDELTNYQGKQYCQDCYRKQIDEEAGSTNYMSTSYTYGNMDYGEGAINTLSLFANIALVIGIVGALISFIGGSTFGVPMGIIILMNGVFCWSLFKVICSMANNLIAIRKNTSK